MLPNIDLRLVSLEIPIQGLPRMAKPSDFPALSKDPFQGKRQPKIHKKPKVRRPTSTRKHVAHCFNSQENPCSQLPRPHRCIRWPWVKIQIVPPVNIPIPTIGSKMGEFTYPQKWDPKTVLTTTARSSSYSALCPAPFAHPHLRRACSMRWTFFLLLTTPTF